MKEFYIMFLMSLALSCKRDPNSTLILSSGKYKGEVLNGLPNGHGVLEFNNGNIYKGDFSNGVSQGKGEFIFSNGDRYLGGFANGNFEGQGTLDSINGAHYDGNFSNGLFNGVGDLIYSNKSHYSGQWLNGQKHGLGKLMYYENGFSKEHHGVWNFDNWNPKNNFDLEELFNKTKDMVFTIYAMTDSFPISGSGFFINEEGYALTNYHVLGDANAAYIKQFNGQENSIIDILYEDKELDFLIFKVKNENNTKFNFPPPASSQPNIGSTCFTISSPNGLSNTLSKGIVSAFRGKNNVWIQTDTPIDHGSSGSPLFNENAEVIGINTRKMNNSDGLNFAVNILRIMEKIKDELIGVPNRQLEEDYFSLYQDYLKHEKSLTDSTKI